MESIDWIILIGTLSLIVFYGVWKNRGHNNIKEYLKAYQKIATPKPQTELKIRKKTLTHKILNLTKIY